MAQSQIVILNPTGINRDIDSYELPMEQWSDGNNIEFDNDKTAKVLGHQQVFGTPTVAPYWLLPFDTISTNSWIYPGLTEIYRVHTSGTDTIHTDLTRVNKVLTGSINPTASTSVVGVGTLFTTELILGQSILVSGETRVVSAIADNTHLTVTVAFTDTANDTSPELVQGDYNATASSGWNGGVLGGVAILNNGVDVPQMMGTANAAKMEALSNWLGNTTCQVMRPFKRFLVALDLTTSSVRYPFRVQWSHPAEGGTVPVTWNPSDATKDAGYVDLSQTPGFVVDCLPLGDTNIIYKEDSIWSMSFEGGQSIFGFRQLFSDVGILGRHCVKDFDNKHFVVSEDDVYMHDGQTRQSIVDGQIRDDLFSSMHPDYKTRTFVAADREKNEMWICFVSNTNDTNAFADTAFVYNFRNNSWSKRDLPYTSYIAWGVLEFDSTTNWSESGTWDTDSEAWDSPLKPSLLLASPSVTKLYALGTNQNAGTSFRAFVEKDNMHLGYPGTKSINKLVPRVSGTGSLDFYVGSEMNPHQGTTWKGPYTFTSGVHSEIPVRATGNYVGIRIESTDDNTWALANLEIHWSPSGNRGSGV